jgi:hypothetical protein
MMAIITVQIPALLRDTIAIASRIPGIAIRPSMIRINSASRPRK